jgi:hypothetical protein
VKDRPPIADRSRSIWRPLTANAAFQTASIVAVLAILHSSLFRYGQLPALSYFEPVLAIEAAKRVEFVLLVGLPLLAMFVEARILSWHVLDPRFRTRSLICGVAGILAWTCSTYPVNLYYDQIHIVDRLLIVAVWVWLWFHPIAIVPFLGMVMVMMGQQVTPLPEGSWTWPDKRLPLDLLTAFAAYLLVRALLRDRVKPFVLPFTLLCVTGAVYGHAAVNKALLGPDLLWWVSNNDLSNLLVSSHVQGGWLRQLSDETIVAIAQKMHVFKLPLAGVTFLIELSGFALAVRWQLTRVLLLGFIAFHVGVLASSGIFFWKWMIVDALLLWYFTMLHRDARVQTDRPASERVACFAPRMSLLAVAVMVAVRFVVPLVPFAWLDTRVVNFFEIYGVSASGERYRLEARFFAPYDILVHQSRHFALVDGPVLVGTYGVTFDPAIARALDNAEPKDLPGLRSRFGQDWRSESLDATYVDFIRRYVVNAQRRGRREAVADWLVPPFHFRTTLPPDTYRSQQRLAAVEIEFLEYLFDGSRIVPIRKVQVARFFVPD